MLIKIIQKKHGVSKLFEGLQLFEIVQNGKIWVLKTKKKFNLKKCNNNVIMFNHN